MAIVIDEATPDHAEAMREVQRRTWVATYPNAEYGITQADIEARFYESPENAPIRRERRRQSVATAPFHAWVATDGETIVGFCTVKQEQRENLVQALYVLPEYQGQGVGKRLLQAALQWFGAGKEIVLNVAAYNEKAIAFYRAFGFVQAGMVAPAETLQLPSGVHLPEIRMIRSV
ncbi:MAG: GNAT family N-acetyltransferase [Chloroflexota bacterium]|nr:GNAT family N-acetyltransferase [Chloroflexota bacterium]